MATPKQLDFSSPIFVDSEDPSPPSPSSRRRSSRKPALNRSSSEAETSKKKRKMNRSKDKKLSSPVINRIWNEEDELVILKGLVDYQAKTGLEPKNDWEAFYHFVRDSIHVKVSKEQLLNKIRKLKGKFLLNLKKINEGNDPNFTRSSDSEAFGFAMMIWGKNEAELANEGLQSESGEERFKEDDEVANSEPLTENGAVKITNKTTGKESDDDDDDDELCALQDAFDTMMSQGLRDYQKKLQLEKLMNLANGKRKELSDEWKTLCVEEVKLNIKKLRFSAKLVEAANDI